MKQLVNDLARDIPHIRRSMLRAMANVQPRHLLDPELSHRVDSEVEEE